ncbi:DUF6503 family protein [uncultured Winogradskyella sp.]|uniref:DUF6503 family protein n=1 Tax=uncultured Winogradskyella sp. TaxID=395353 RepID=UPI0026192B51|nr:DUF6503 family protein [uncultured Winogradskyella sp.]
MKQLLIFIVLFLFFACKNEQEKDTLSVNEIISKSIEVAGGDKFENSIIRFNFRDKFYMARREHGNFNLIRIFKSSNDSVFDLLTNNGFERVINDTRIKLEDSMVTKYMASVNSVHYFSVLPYGLNNKAVNKKLLGEEEIRNKAYYKVEITFNKAGGGEDYEDVFLYWINKISFKVDYLAYSYNEDDGKGLRFRAAFNERYVNGLRFVDYKNYKETDQYFGLKNLGKAFSEGGLKMVSKIELENVEVDIIE